MPLKQVLARAPRALPLSVLALVALPAVASAHGVSVSSDTITYTASGAANVNVAQPDFGDHPGWFEVTDFTATIDLPAGSLCDRNSFSPDNIVWCPPTGITKIHVVGSAANDTVSFDRSVADNVAGQVELGDGDDSLSDQSGGAVAADGGPGTDTLSGFGGGDTLHGGAGDDTLNDAVDTGTVAPNHLFGDAGNDGITMGDDGGDAHGGDGNDTIDGGNGADQIDGDAGNDQLTGWAGQDTLNGGDGNDTLNAAHDSSGGGAQSADTYIGGAGEDTVDYGDRDSGGAPVDVSLDNVANDGQAGENDDVGPDGSVEDVIASANAPGTLTGDAGPNVLSALNTFGQYPVAINGLGGDDTIHGGSGNDTLHGGDGNDTVSGQDGDDHVYGDAGNDTVTGWFGDDVVDGGPGTDSLDGADGNDQVEARDGQVDQIQCGLGADTVDGDYFDVVGLLCESVTLTQRPTPPTPGGGNSGGGGGNPGGGGGNPGGGGGNTGGGGTSTGPTGPSTAALSHGVSSAASSATKALKKAGLKSLARKGSYSHKVKAAGRGRYTESVTVKPSGKASAARKHKKAKAVKFASAGKSFAKAGTATLKVKLTRTGKKLAKKSRKLTLTVKSSFKVTGHETVTRTRTVTVKR